MIFGAVLLNMIRLILILVLSSILKSILSLSIQHVSHKTLPLVISSESFTLHKAPYHPESPERISASLAMISEMEKEKKIEFKEPNHSRFEEALQIISIII